MRIEVCSQINGGKMYYYPKNEAARVLCNLMQRKCLVFRDFEFLKMLNMEIIVQNEKGA